MPKSFLALFHCASVHAAATLCLLACCAGSAPAADKAADQASIDRVNAALVKAGEAYRAGKPDDATAALAEAQTAYKGLDASAVDPALKPTVERIGERIAAADRLLKKPAAAPSTPDKGTSEKPTSGKSTPDDSMPDKAKNDKPINGAKKLPAKAPVKPAAKSTPKPDAKSGDKPAAKSPKAPKGRKGQPKGPSFHDEVAPILLAKCGGCHVKESRGGLNMATFTEFAKGGKNGPVVYPGASGQSSLVGAILSGKMPKGDGPKVTPEELRTIASWIDGGARYDGEDRDSPLGQKAAEAPVEIEGLVKSTGQESVQFNRDLADTLVTHCAGCHGGDTPSGQLRLETFGDLLKGGVSGGAIEPGKPGESLITKRMRGEDGERMPQDKPALPEATIARFETWIKEGAKFDGVDPARSLKMVVEDQAASRMSHDELVEKRLAQGLKMWQLAAPDEKPAHRQTANFILIGNLSEARLDQLADVAEAEREKIARFLKLPADQPMFKGNLVIFIFKRAFDYSEFVQMVEKREAPRGMVGHWQAKGLDAYACVTALADSDADLPALMAEQIAGAYLQSVAAPGWFSAGGARALASKIEPKSAIVKQWDAESVTAAGASKMTDALFKTKTFDEEATARSYAFVRFLLTTGPKFQSLMSGLKDGHAFPHTLHTVYGTDAQGLLENFSRRPQPKQRR
ncbi:MAG TPA: c-type cytochrome domain-containing protein [Pirellulales bacterium]|jgi:cytochrome c553